MGIVFCNGQFLSEGDLKLPFTDRGFLFGDGVFTTLRVADGAIENFDLHVKRLRENCRDLNIEFPVIDPGWLTELVNQNEARQGIWRLKIIITGGDSPDLDLAPRSFGRLIMTLAPFQPPSIPYKLTICSSFALRPVSRVKSLSYLDRLWVMNEAKKKGFHDAVTTTSEGFFLEAAFSNLFWRQGEVFYTPDSSLPLLPGVALSVIKRAVESFEMNVCGVRATLEDIPSDSQVFICNSMVKFHPVERIQDKPFPRDVRWEEQLKRALRNSLLSTQELTERI
jgi:4-amino-4-deoxychorismate lyase